MQSSSQPKVLGHIINNPPGHRPNFLVLDLSQISETNPSQRRGYKSCRLCGVFLYLVPDYLRVESLGPETGKVMTFCCSQECAELQRLRDNEYHDRMRVQQTQGHDFRPHKRKRHF